MYAIRYRRRICEFSNAGRIGPPSGRLRKQLREALGAQEKIRSDESFPDEPEHQAGIDSQISSRRGLSPVRMFPGGTFWLQVLCHSLIGFGWPLGLGRRGS